MIGLSEGAGAIPSWYFFNYGKTGWDLMQFDSDEDAIAMAKKHKSVTSVEKFLVGVIWERKQAGK